MGSFGLVFGGLPLMKRSFVSLTRARMPASRACVFMDTASKLSERCLSTFLNPLALRRKSVANT